jgi:phthiocerol/phenolphthiocerol synthesis type-I polyketide synthase E
MRDLTEPIAIIGISIRAPGARDFEEFWRNLDAGRETISFPTDEELLSYGVPQAELDDPHYVRAVPTLPDAEWFDADLFGMSRREAELCDPQLRLFLEMTHAAIENAGYDPDRMDGSVGVYGTSGPNAYLREHILRRPDVVTDGLALMTSNNLDYVTTFSSYKLNLQGPSFTVLSACSSSLVALHLACQALRIGECDMAIAGGAFVLFPFGHGYVWSPGSIWSRDGHCRALDAAASGTIFGSGAAAVMLKRLDAALADGDNIRAVIRGSAINNDGGVKSSFSAPAVDGQVAVVMEAMAVAGCVPQDISYVEMHATGTLLGDPVEMAALNRAYRLLSGEPLEPASCLVGSVKANVGHLVAVAGLAGLAKVVAALEHETFAPSINVSRPNPKLNLESTPFAIEDRARPWKRQPGRPRRAGLSSLGIGGTNAHVILEEAPPPPRVRADGRPRIIVWSGRNEAAADAYRADLARFFGDLDDDRFADAVATLQQGRTEHSVRRALVSRDPADAAAALAGVGRHAHVTGWPARAAD